ncbi:MAG: hypothetical protein AAF269_09645, partial [Pseudomonadota bacterium]
QRQRLRNRIRVILLAAVAMLGVLGSITALVLLDLERTKDELQESDNSLFANSVGAQGCDQSCPNVPAAAGPDVVAASPAPPSRSLGAAPSSAGSGSVSAAEQKAADDLVARLNSTDRDTRIQAGQRVANALRETDNAAVLRSLVIQLERPARDALSASGRFNILYMINLSDGWERAEIESDLRAAIVDIKDRANAGVAIGNQTRDCLTKIDRRLDGDDTASRRCGGR